MKSEALLRVCRGCGLFGTYIGVEFRLYISPRGTRNTPYPTQKSCKTLEGLGKIIVSGLEKCRNTRNYHPKGRGR